jgi:voltage-gated potassium channel
VSLRRSVHALLEQENPSHAAVVVRFALAALIVANLTAIVVETVPAVRAAGGAWFDTLETTSVLIFGIEYLLRAWAAPEQPRYAGRSGRLRWAVSPLALIDLAAILPSLLQQSGLDLRVLRLLRLARIVRIAKLGRYSVAVQTLHRVVRAKAPDLLSLLFLLMVLLVVSSTVMFHLEHDAQPNGFSSIPATMWWGIVTLTTIGYGDLAPVTAGGRVFGGVIAVLGIAMFALPAGLLGAAFVDELGKARTQHRGGTAPAACPHCGKALEPR